MMRVNHERLSRRYDGLLRFEAETGTFLADSLEAWCRVILSKHKVETGRPLAPKWQEKSGPLPLGKRRQCLSRQSLEGT